MLSRIHVDAISAFKDIKNHIEMQRLFSLCLLIHLIDAFFFNENVVVRDGCTILGINPAFNLSNL